MKTIKRADNLWELAEFCADSIYNYQNSEHSDKSVLIADITTSLIPSKEDFENASKARKGLMFEESEEILGLSIIKVPSFYEDDKTVIFGLGYYGGIIQTLSVLRKDFYALKDILHNFLSSHIYITENQPTLVCLYH